MKTTARRRLSSANNGSSRGSPMYIPWKFVSTTIPSAPSVSKA